MFRVAKRGMEDVESIAKKAKIEEDDVEVLEIKQERDDDIEVLMNDSEDDEEVEMDEETGEVAVKVEADGDWGTVEPLPAGWRSRQVARFGGRRHLLQLRSPRGQVVAGRRAALAHMVQEGYTSQEVEVMRSVLHYEGWLEDPRLPPGWRYKLHPKKQTKDFMLHSGEVVKGVAKAMEYLQSSESQDEDQVINFQQFLASELKLKQENEEWQDDASLPAGWKIREMAMKRNFLLSPEGKWFVGKRTALRHMIKKGFPEGDIAQMKDSMGREGWGGHRLLPEGWMLRKVPKTSTKSGAWSAVQLISSEGVYFTSYKLATDFMEKEAGYGQEDVERMKELMQDMSARSRLEINQEGWREEAGLPAGWKIKLAEAHLTEKEWFLAHDGQQFNGRRLALQHMLGNGYKEADICTMKATMEGSGWSSHNLLPAGWIVRKEKQKTPLRKTGDFGRHHFSIMFISSEGDLFNSFVKASEYLTESGKYTEDDVSKLQELKVELANNRRLGNDHLWKEEDNLPEGWKVKTVHNQNELHTKRFYLSPEGTSIGGARQALQHMVERQFGEEDLERMRSYMVTIGWQVSHHLPQGWLYKARSTKSKSGIHTSTWILANDGNYFESIKLVADHMKAPGTSYTDNDVRKLDLFKDDLCSSRRLEHGGWMELDDLPAGWKTRKINEKSFFLTPDNQQCPGFRRALLFLVQNSFPEEEVAKMRAYMQQHEWRVSPHLPAGWMYRTYRNATNKGLFILTRDITCLQSYQSAREHMKGSPGYTKADFQRFDLFVEETGSYKVLPEGGIKRTQGKKQAGDLPAGWRHGGSTARQFIVSPTGQQFPSRVKALQHMLREGVGEEAVEEMRRMVEHEGWQGSRLLPAGWILGTRRVEKHASVSFLTTEGHMLDSYRAAGAYMKRGDMYTDQDIANLMELMEEKARDRRREGQAGGEKGEKEKKAQFRRKADFHITSDGSNFPNKRLALKFLIENKFPNAEVDELRGKLEQDGWKTDAMLPEGWKYKMLKYRQFSFLTPQADKLNGVQAAKKTIQTDYNQDAVENFQNFVEIQAVATRANKYDWNTKDETIPEGWKSRKTGSKLFILSPDGAQFCSRKQCLQYMIKEGFEPEELEEMRRLCGHEGWRESGLLPEGWILQSNASSFQLITHLGEVFDSYKTVITFMERSEEFGQEDVNKVIKLMEENTRRKSALPAKGQVWEEDATLPAGWRVRREERAGAMVEVFVTREGKQVVGRPSALEHAVGAGYTMEEVAALRAGLKVFGWEVHPFLPEGWLSRSSGDSTSFYTPDNRRLEGHAALLEHLLEEGHPFSVTGPVAREVEWPALAMARRQGLQDRLADQMRREQR